jgi:hypothetical protein
VAGACLAAMIAACGSDAGTDTEGDGNGAANDAEAGAGDATAGGAVDGASGADARADVGEDADAHAGADANANADADSSADAHAATDSGTDAVAHDSSTTDASNPIDASHPDANLPDSAGGGVITGGACLSGAPGATAYRVRFIDAGGQAQVDYEVDGLPDHSRDKAGAYGYEIGFTSEFVDPFLGEGGLQLDDSDFVDLEISTVGVSSITSATLSVYGRSYSVDTDGSFNWQSFTDTGSAPVDFVSNVAPYAWYSADLGDALDANDGNVYLRIKAGDSSGALVVSRIEICVVAN